MMNLTTIEWIGMAVMRYRLRIPSQDVCKVKYKTSYLLTAVFVVCERA